MHVAFDIITFPRAWAFPLTWTYTRYLHDAMEIQTLVKLIGGVGLTQRNDENTQGPTGKVPLKLLLKVPESYIQLHTT